jgi:hypothetical protein
MSWSPFLVESDESGRIRMDHPLVDRYLEFVAARGRRNTLLAAAYDLKVSFTLSFMTSPLKGITCSGRIRGSSTSPLRNSLSRSSPQLDSCHRLVLMLDRPG